MPINLIMNFKDICDKGKYYNPASSHYPNSVSSVVVCDRCRRQNLKVCIGYAESDLCLKCVEEVVELMSRSGPVAKMEQRQYHPPVHTRMLQGMFRDEGAMTYMMQNQYQEDFISLRGGNAGPTRQEPIDRNRGNSVYKHKLEPKYSDYAYMTLMESPRFK